MINVEILLDMNNGFIIKHFNGYIIETVKYTCGVYSHAREDFSQRIVRVIFERVNFIFTQTRTNVFEMITLSTSFYTYN